MSLLRCPFCGADESHTSHYHCANCGEESGMYGHYRLDSFTCEAKPGWDERLAVTEGESE